MDEEATSWIRRTKFSHTVSYRLNSSKLSSFPLKVNQETRPQTSDKKLVSSSSQDPPSTNVCVVVDSEVQRDPVTNKQRSVSPSPPQMQPLPDVFNEARSERKRFSTPHPRRMDSEKGMKVRLSHKDSFEKRRSFNLRSPSVPIRDLGTLRIQERVKKGKKDAGWSKLFDNGGGGRRVSAAEASEEYRIDMSKLFFGLRFAHGLYSRLYHGKYEDKAVAVKLITVPDDDEDGCLGARLEKQFTKEVTLLSRLSHPNVIKFVGAYKDPPVYCVLTEYLPEGSLRSFLHKPENRSLSLKKLIEFALDIARGMEYIHSRHVIHRDLKPENVLIDEDFQLKIADFGIACEEEYCDMFADDPGTYRWMAPEMIKRKPHGRKADVYSFGLVLWEMVAGAIPYEDMNPIQAAFAVVHKNIRPAVPGDCPVAMKALIEQCWSVAPDKRPEFWQIVKVLEEFEDSLEREGCLNLISNKICKDPRKGLKHWIQKLGPAQGGAGGGGGSSVLGGSALPKPKFA
ncbi:Protein kinase superfamily protein [Raphanus sativus]|uniref:Serine/threonine/tyrosine-protein kinase HT1 n=1 Tax=Raphanus sativus TaxID=3726 RepID=A0A6J0MY77_RAPSA|nr:serine/threonine/tyrosine-protein kinase HT1 [Raphanus sativus]KAJ4907890.1 Protein kinase superfamily protein [Raphanus sativus]